MCQSVPKFLSTITTTGIGRISIPKDKVDVRLAIQHQLPTATEAQIATANGSEKVIELLRDYNVADLQTDNLSLHPVYDYNARPMKLVAWESTNAISFSTIPDLAGQIIDKAVLFGATRVDSVIATSSVDKQEKAHLDALEIATQDARVRADKVAAAGGVCIGGVYSLSADGHRQHPAPVLYAAREAAMVSDGSTVIPGVLEVVAHVTGMYTIIDC